MTLLSVQGLGKAFQEYRSELHRFGRWFGLPFEPVRETWVLRQVNFEIERGAAIGVIGQNGAGKSTLLKLIAGTIHPTEGRIEINGRVAAILELGMGFDLELTGRQNVQHAASLMGFNASDIADAMPHIEGFAEIGDYFDQPMRTYSSGMEMRVAFAVATAWRPDILIVDEALSVGDSYFQHKSFARMREFRDQGTSLLIVSHDTAAIKNLCDRAILIENGSITKDGSPKELYHYYNAIIADKKGSSISVAENDHGDARTVSGTGEARVVEATLHGSDGKALEFVDVGTDVELRITVQVNAPIETLVLGFGIQDRLGQIIFGTNTKFSRQLLHKLTPGQTVQYTIRFTANLGVGSYAIQTALVDSDSHLSANYDWQEMVIMFNVFNSSKPHFEGCLWSDPTIEIRTSPP